MAPKGHLREKRIIKILKRIRWIQCMVYSNLAKKMAGKDSLSKLLKQLSDPADVRDG